MNPEFKGFILFKERAYFKSGASSTTDVGRLRIRKEDLIDFARNANALTKMKTTKSGVWVFDEALYKRLLVYAVALDGVKKRSALRVLKLTDVVSKLDDYSLHFWYTEAVSRFKQGGLINLRRVSRSLRALYGVDK